MKTIFGLLVVLMASFVACKEKVSQNQELYNEVMSIHDEVMPKMDDIYRRKTELRNVLAADPGMPVSEKEKIGKLIARLDSAAESMMVWMREFDPLPDSVGEDKARAYLENEKAKISEVRENLESALRDAGGS